VWDERYDTEDYVYGRQPNSFVVEYSKRVPKGRVLCLAEGEGRNAVFLAGLGYDVVGVDSSGVGLDGLEIVHGRELVRPVHEGSLHHGDSAVVQVVARKP
jgi:hypothetical protein